MANVAAAAILATIPTMFLLKQLTIHLAKIELLFFVSMKAFSNIKIAVTKIQHLVNPVKPK